MTSYRSMLFVPANDRKKAAKAMASPADCVILDLEDAVALAEKQAARTDAGALLAERGGRDVYVRVNSFDSSFLYDDLLATIAARPTGIMLPKAESGEQIRSINWLIEQLERAAGMPPESIGLIALIESAAGIHHAPDIAGSCKRLRGLAFGAIDYALDIGISLSENGQELLYARSRVVTASRMGGCGKPIDTVYPHFKDDAGLQREAEAARGLGFQGKMVIHPGQIDTVHRVFSPTAEEIAAAERIVAAFAAAEQQGLAAIHLDGKMIDYPVMKRARQLLGR